MTREEAIEILTRDDSSMRKGYFCINDFLAIEKLKEIASQEPIPNYKSFCEWVANEIFAEEWDWNKDAFAEIACRKLAKLGIVARMYDEWVLMESEDKE